MRLTSAGSKVKSKCVRLYTQIGLVLKDESTVDEEGSYWSCLWICSRHVDLLPTPPTRQSQSVTTALLAGCQRVLLPPMKSRRLLCKVGLALKGIFSLGHPSLSQPCGAPVGVASRTFSVHPDCLKGTYARVFSPHQLFLKIILRFQGRTSG